MLYVTFNEFMCSITHVLRSMDCGWYVIVQVDTVSFMYSWTRCIYNLIGVRGKHISHYHCYQLYGSFCFDVTTFHLASNGLAPSVLFGYSVFALYLFIFCVLKSNETIMVLELNIKKHSLNLFLSQFINEPVLYLLFVPIFIFIFKILNAYKYIKALFL